MKSIISLFFLTLAAAQSTRNYRITAGVGRNEQPLPAPHKTLAISWSTSDLIIGPETNGFPINFEPFPDGNVKSFYYPSGSMYFQQSSAVPGLYDLKWRFSGPLGDIFSASGCGCGAHCGGPCLLPANSAGGYWVTNTPKDEGAGGWKIGWWNGTGGLPASYRQVFLWREDWS